MKTSWKPSWDDAPKWANWLAMDCDGSWFWYSHTPNAGDYSWRGGPDIMVEYAGGGFDRRWMLTIESRKPGESV